MKDVFTFYRAVDPMKGSWDGYGHFPLDSGDFLAFVTDAPSGASIQTPQLIKDFWLGESLKKDFGDFPNVQLADALNRLQNDLQTRGRRENILYQATIAMARKTGSKLYYCCIGDSVLQIYRAGKMYRLNESEVWDGSLISTRDHNVQDRQKTQEIRFIGSNGSFIQISEIRTLDLKDQDLLLFYTDGVEDLLPPNRLLQSIDSPANDFRARLENIFAQDKVKDDATLLALPIQIPSTIQPEKEIALLRDQLEKLQKEQKDTQRQLSEVSSTRVRLEKVETTLSQVARDMQDVQRLSKRAAPVTAMRPSVISARTGISIRKKSSLFWLIPLLTLALGTAAGAFLFRGKEEPVPQKIRQHARTAEPREPVIAPPEIPSAADCTYIIQKGDTLQQIAASRQLTVQQLLTWNPSQKKEAPLHIGDSLTVCKETP